MENKKDKTSIFCSMCQKDSGYFVEDFIQKKVEKVKYCKSCKAEILDRPDFANPSLN